MATPFFIGTISKGRTIRQTVFGGYFFGLAGTFTSFIILGNQGLGLQLSGKLDLLGLYAQTQDLYQAIIAIFETMPLAKAGLVLLALTMIAFYATSFDALAIVASSYSYKSLDADQEPDKRVKLFWAILLMLLPIALIFSENFHGKPADRVHHRCFSHWLHYLSHRLELFQGCKAVSGVRREPCSGKRKRAGKRNRPGEYRCEYRKIELHASMAFTKSEGRILSAPSLTAARA